MFLSILFLLLPVALFITAAKLWDHQNTLFEGVGMGALVVGLITAMCFYFSLPCCRMDDRNTLIKYEVTVQALEKSREQKDTALERAAILRDIIEINTAIEAAKYWNGYFDLWNNDEVIKLEPLR